MKPRSKKRAQLYIKERVPLVKRLLEEKPFCERCKVRRSQDVHEIKSRARGGSILDESNLACLCRACHSFITQNPKQAHAEGFLKNSWE